MTFKNIALAASAALAFIANPAAAAESWSYTIPAHSTRQITINVERDFAMQVIGNSVSDLDFRLVSAAGRTLHEDIDGTSWTESYIEADSTGVYRLYVQNVGDSPNAVVLTIE